MHVLQLLCCLNFIIKTWVLLALIGGIHGATIAATVAATIAPCIPRVYPISVFSSLSYMYM